MSTSDARQTFCPGWRRAAVAKPLQLLSLLSTASAWTGACSLVLFAFAFARVAGAAEPPEDTVALPCRPTIACTADIVRPGALEIETGALFRRLAAGTRQWTFPFVLKLTTAEWFQLQVGSNGFTLARGPAPAEFLDDVQIGGKVHLVDQTSARPSISVSATASIPTVAAAGYLRTYDAFFIAYVTKDIGPVHADLNLGENVWRVEGPSRPQEFVALALSTNLAPPFGMMAEGYYFTDASPLASRDGGILFAVSETPRPWLVFDFGGDAGLFPATREYSLFVGMTFVAGSFWTQEKEAPLASHLP